MDSFNQTGFLKKNKLFISFAIIFSGICWYLSCGLSGNFWYLLWLAPAPILFISFNVSKGQAFLIAFVAYLIGRLSWFPYLLTVIPAVIAVVFTLILPLVFAVVVVLSRKIVLISSHWLSAFAFPVLWVCFEYAMFLFSRDGTIGSLAYTQCNFLPVLQIASITGIQGITFLVTFIPSAIAVAIFYRQKIKSAVGLISVSTSLLLVVLAFGAIRIANNHTEKGFTIAMTAIDEKSYHNVYDPDSQNEIHIANLYLGEITNLATQNVQVILLPEKAIIVNDSTDTIIKQMFQDAARKYQVMIIIGVTKIKKGYFENNAWVISDEGALAADYQKVNLFEGEAAEGFKPGKTPGLFNHATEKEGIAICKDLDFQQFMLGYGKEKIAVLYAPAWDFVADGWLHCRMAILRGVEGGYPIARNARQGRLTISDQCGKVLYEASSENKKRTILIGKLPAKSNNSVYSNTGDWFSFLNIIAALYFIFLMMKKKTV